ncbi:MAG TPA: TonB-dependent receptor, partial [Oligoflexus sp.]|uniref:TonB-dependent receptor plug domain-containing protein n=1 Tax=Oligoflexus sp. TaxID=1971216 RepID=UPI002D45BA5A
SKAGLQNVTRDGIQLNAGNNTGNIITLGKTEVMKVTAAREMQTSSKSSFFSGDIRNAPSVRQDIKDIIRRAPDVVVDNGRLSVGGANNRFNSITIDGMRQDDSFGLNSNGYPTQRSPISLQAVQEISVERSPFDVRYGNFLGGGINVVTKSGTDEFEGSVFVTRTTDGLTGKKSKDRSYKTDFEENRVGLTLGGPIIKEKLHFFANIEGLTSTSPASAGPVGSGRPFEVERVTLDDEATVQEIAGRVYGFDAGESSKSLKEEDLKGLLKLDYALNSDNRLEFKYQRSQGNNISSGSATDRRLFLSSNSYDKSDKMDNLSLRLFSDWSEALSTKVEISNKKVVTEQKPLNGNDFMEAEVKTPANGSIFLGPDQNRHMNELENSSNILAAEANYLMDEHLITGGVQLEQVDIYNLFVPASNGAATYDTAAAFEARTPSRFLYRNAISGNVNDAAADWSYNVSTFFLQDEWQLTPRLTARGGVRADLYSANGDIEHNENFVDRYGFSNTEDISGKQAILPRLGLAYKATDDLRFRGGFGLFGGGTPAVWISNSYTNDGVTVDEVELTGPSAAQVAGFDGRNIPASVTSQLASDGSVDALDPSFKIPQSYKFQTGLDYKFDIPDVMDDVMFDLNYTYTRTRYGLLWKDLRRDNPSFTNNLPTAVGPDGRAIYDTTPATATAGTDFNASRGQDMLMTNTDKGYGHTASMSLYKRFNTGWNVSTSYAWQDVQEVNPGTSSVSTSNYGIVPIQFDPNNPGLDRSIYETKHRILFSTGYETNFFEDLMSSVNLIFERRSGQPYSFTMGGNRDTLARMYGESSTFSFRNRMLFYVPKGDGSDVILDGIAEEDLNAFINKYGLNKYRGKIAPRNAFFSDWVQKLDMRLAQELPGYGDTGKARLVLDIENLPNFLNKNWGQVKQVDFPYMAAVSEVSYDAASNRYIYSKLRTTQPDSVRLLESVWKLQVGLSYDF